MMRKTLGLSAALIAATAATAGMAHAEVELSGNVALTSDYHWRGFTQTSKDPAIQGGFDAATGGFYAGVWGSNITGGAEFDLYAGYAGAIGETGFGYDVGIISYHFTPDWSDNQEIYAGLSYEADAYGASGYFYYDPDNETMYAEAGVGFAVSEALSVDANFGKVIDNGDDSSDYEPYNFNLGGTYSVGGFDLDLRYYDAEDPDQGEAEDNVVFSIARSL